MATEPKKTLKGMSKNYTLFSVADPETRERVQCLLPVMVIHFYASLISILHVHERSSVVFPRNLVIGLSNYGNAPVLRQYVYGPCFPNGRQPSQDFLNPSMLIRKHVAVERPDFFTTIFC